MSNPEGVHLSVRSSLPEMQLLGFVALREISEKGYVVVLSTMAKQQQVLGYTLGLAKRGHPEIVSIGGDEDDVFGLLAHLASQVVEHGQVFSEGTHNTSLFSELIFSEPEAELHTLPLTSLILGDTPIRTLHCREPRDFAVIQKQSAH
ncbi:MULTISPECIES: DUF4262 domain-containing protein [Actinomycetes]|uniref:DUF4262 domain-containing protein n=1 Tax=Actinomycetes TaxID=1760 RepID=UPI003400AC80